MKMSITNSTFTIYCHTKEIITDDKGVRGVGHVVLQSKIHVCYLHIIEFLCYVIQYEKRGLFSCTF